MGRLLAAVAAEGANYFMELHWDKFQLLCVRCAMEIQKPDTGHIAAKESMGYLGTTLSEDGRLDAELGRRLGKAWGEFCKLERLWKHTTLQPTRRMEVFQAVVAPTLLYSLSTSWLSTAQQRRLDGFQNRCLRRILKIKPAYFSRVSNKTVLQRASQQAYSNQLLYR